MTYFQSMTDASDLYRPTSAAEASVEDTAVKGNLADLMRNRTLVKATFFVPRIVEYPSRQVDINPISNQSHG